MADGSDRKLVEKQPRIVLFGVGGAGCNVIQNMVTVGLGGVEFIAANTDAQSLKTSNAGRVIQLGANLTEGLGAGSSPGVGLAAAEESIEEISECLSDVHMCFVVAGMGGGTGTGAAPVVARAAREKGILTVGVVTKPFHFEGQRRMKTADLGIEELQKNVDTLIVIPNQNLFRIANDKTTFADAFAMADQVLYSGVACITDLMVKEGLINLDFADVRSVMREMGKAMMGTGEASGEGRAMAAAEAAIANPLLDESSMKGARGLLISITGGRDMTLFEVDEAATRIREEVDPDANIILGATIDDALEGVIRVSVVATGLDQPSISPAVESRPAPRLRDNVAPTNRTRLPQVLPGTADPLYADEESAPSGTLIRGLAASIAQAREGRAESAEQGGSDDFLIADRRAPQPPFRLQTSASVPVDGDDTLEIPTFLRRQYLEDRVAGKPAASSNVDLLQLRRLQGSGGVADDPTERLVDLSVFSRTRAPIGETLLVQVFLHLPDQDPERAATAADSMTAQRSQKTLLAPLAKNDFVTLTISAPGCEIEDTTETLCWRGAMTSANFMLVIRSDDAGQPIPVTIRAFRNGEPLGRIAFLVEVVGDEKAASVPTEMVGHLSQRYRNMFVSYASADREVVVRYTHAWSLLDHQVFQDFLSLRAGERWEPKLFEAIRGCDVFLLFWSEAARQSSYVLREAEFALELKSAGHEIDIIPVVIQGPPMPAPPPSLNMLHFNDRFAYIVSSVMREAEVRRNTSP